MRILLAVCFFCTALVAHAIYSPGRLSKPVTAAPSPQAAMKIDASDCNARGYTPNVFYSCKLVVIGGPPGAYVWKIDSGMFAPGLTLDTNTGVISGIVRMPATPANEKLIQASR